MTCPLCLNINIEYFIQDSFREYWQCQNCSLVFVSQEQRLNAHEEKSIYDRHENSPNDMGYRNFLNKLLIPLIKKLRPGSRGLDFGSGPGPTISAMLKELGFDVVDYDIFYANYNELLQQKYDFITCTEVLEHLYYPHKEITLITNMLQEKAYLGIMTKRVINKARFATWHYKNDPTHVCFYCDKAFEYIADYWDYDLEIISSDTIILTKC
ncbi:MAG: class I SAM-dependent methyltransferase [Proteobacteria bacterium]|nr:class I SAM-dependent methyltransferase [Pseudomonadota bacterium]